MQKYWRVIAALCALSGSAGLIAAEPTGAAADQKYRLEAADLRLLADDTCTGCFGATLFGTVIALPARYVVQVSPIDTQGCTTFVSPRWALMKRLKPPGSLSSFQTESGTIRYCSLGVLESEIGQVERETPADQQIRVGRLTVSVWRAASSGKSPRRHVNVYVRDEKEALWISDPNPYLWRAMLSAIDPDLSPEEARSDN